MFKKLFGKKESEPFAGELAAPLTGKAVQLEDVPDPVFSQKMMGDGIAIDPAEGVVVAPVTGEIVQIFPTKHAVGIKSKDGIEILIHIGLETVAMNGEGFEAHVSQGDTVKKGDKLISFDLDLIREKAKSTVTPIIITNGDDFGGLQKTSEQSLTRGTTVLLTVAQK
ncbi:PTS glucose transporter subunit IIA [Bacillus sp. M6-12]|uniref:PTS sugar transporter subunit IIA n=1 Tax=Bacillus sp. M6-12 TaxID=2054166 RepID=UPI000C75C412|nr:PTS glucose transporter subunit IIA [Bacillus sp. M6-12]PLS16248.1 PTS glucose transporter subunit IIA [Bacillus sp. M6-12]